MAQNEIYRVQMKWSDTNQGRDLTSAFYVRQSTVTGFDVTDIGEQVKDWWNSGIGAGVAQKTFHASTHQLDAVRLRKWSPLEPTETEYTTGLPIVGTGAGEPLPNENAILLSPRTANIGRSYRSRLYLPPPSEGMVAENLTVTNADNCAEAFVELINALTSIGALGTASAIVGTWSKTLGVFTPTTRVLVDQFIRSQRRRNPRVAAYQQADV